MIKRIRQDIGYFLGGIIGLSFLTLLSMSWGEKYLMPGPKNVGHQNLDCEYCHIKTPGTFRQQIQANVRYLLGKRSQPVDFGRKIVSNEACLGCHQRSNDRHPVYRFFEPRYKAVREKFKPQFCTSCHLEHSGSRVTIVEFDFCQSCHEKLVLKKDPLSISHKDLIAAERWTSCLGCHDFHGNHKMKTETELSKIISPERILEYFQGAPSPYADKKFHLATKKPKHEN